MRFVIDNMYSKDINMFVSCQDDSKTVLYTYEGDKPKKISCNEKIKVQANTVGQILIMMSNLQSGNFYL